MSFIVANVLEWVYCRSFFLINVIPNPTVSNRVPRTRASCSVNVKQLNSTQRNATQRNAINTNDLFIYTQDGLKSTSTQIAPAQILQLIR